jgi:hypothetical protein
MKTQQSIDDLRWGVVINFDHGGLWIRSTLWGFRNDFVAFTKYRAWFVYTIGM